MADYIAHSEAERLIVVDIPDDRYAIPQLGITYDRMAGIVDAMRSQTRYLPGPSYSIPSHGAQVTIWGRREGD